MTTCLCLRTSSGWRRSSSCTRGSRSCWGRYSSIFMLNVQTLNTNKQKTLTWQVRQLESEKLHLRDFIQDIKDQNELLEFRILELEVKTLRLQIQSHYRRRLNDVSCSGEGATIPCHQLPTVPLPRRPQSSADLLRGRRSHSEYELTAEELWGSVIWPERLSVRTSWSANWWRSSTFWEITP